MSHRPWNELSARRPARERGGRIALLLAAALAVPALASAAGEVTPATGASLGFGPKGKTGHLTVPLCAPCKSPVSTGVGMDKSLIAALRQHLLFVVVRTKKFPNGEIRGQILG